MPSNLHTESFLARMARNQIYLRVSGIFWRFLRDSFARAHLFDLLKEVFSFFKGKKMPKSRQDCDLRSQSILMLRNVSPTVQYSGFTPPQVAKTDNILLTFFTIFSLLSKLTFLSAQNGFYLSALGRVTFSLLLANFFSIISSAA